MKNGYLNRKLQNQTQGIAQQNEEKTMPKPTAPQANSETNDSNFNSNKDKLMNSTQTSEKYLSNAAYSSLRKKYKSNITRAVQKLESSFHAGKDLGMVMLQGKDFARYNSNLRKAVLAAKQGEETYTDDKNNIRTIPKEILSQFRSTSTENFHKSDSDFVLKRAIILPFISRTTDDGRLVEIKEVEDRWELLVSKGQDVLERRFFRKCIDAELFFHRLFDGADGIELLRGPNSYREEVNRFLRDKLDFEKGKIKSIEFPRRVGFLVALHQYLVPNEDFIDFTYRNTLTSILKNEVIPPDISTECNDRAESWVRALCEAPSQNAFTDVTQTTARLRIRALKKILRFMSKEDPTNSIAHLRDVAERIELIQRDIAKKYKKERRNGTVTSYATLNSDGHHSSLQREELLTLLGFLADEDISKYHYALICLSTLLRPQESRRLVLQTSEYLSTSSDAWGWEVNQSKVIRKTGNTKLHSKISIVANLILQLKNFFPVEPFSNQDWSTSHRNNYRSRLGFKMYDRRLRTTGAVMLTICENESNSMQRPSTRTILKSRGGWTKSSSMDMDVYCLGNIEGSTQLPGIFFDLEKVTSRRYYKDCDLLEGQISWDAFLLKHFIDTHTSRISEQFENPAERESKVSEFLQIVKDAQDSFFKWDGYTRRHTASKSRVVQYMEQGHHYEAMGELAEIVRFKSDEKALKLAESRKLGDPGKHIDQTTSKDEVKHIVLDVGFEDGEV